MLDRIMRSSHGKDNMEHRIEIRRKEFGQRTISSTEEGGAVSMSPSTSLLAAVGPSITMAATQALIEEASGNMAKAEWWRGKTAGLREACAIHDAANAEHHARPEAQRKDVAVDALVRQFLVGDIVEWSGGRICNGKYGVIAIGPYGDLCVLDNEGAPDMDVAGHEHELTVVGTEKDNADLLNIFVSNDQTKAPQ